MQATEVVLRNLNTNDDKKLSSYVFVIKFIRLKNIYEYFTVLIKKRVNDVVLANYFITFYNFIFINLSKIMFICFENYHIS